MSQCEGNEMIVDNTIRMVHFTIGQRRDIRMICRLFQGLIRLWGCLRVTVVE